MTELFDGVVWVHYSQIYVISDPDAFLDGWEQAMDGQVNGLCQAGTPGLLYLVAGTHTGSIHVRVERLEQAPVLGDQWEEVVEVSFRPRTARVSLTQWAGEDSWPLALEVTDYRVRFSAVNIDAGSDDERPEDDEVSESFISPDRYLLQFWPSSPAPDTILRQTGQSARYWHSEAAKVAKHN